MTVDNNSIFDSQSIKYKASLVGKIANAVNNINSYVKNIKVFCSIKVTE